MKPHPLLAKPGQRALVLGNHAIVRGALEAGVGFVSAYPGTPSSEIASAFEALADQAGVYFEYSTNEKVALEVGAGAAYSGARTLVSMKHVGLNVALEPLMSLAYTGVPAGLVIVTAGDPGCHSSQNEQDNRLLARLSGLPCLEPATPEQARLLTRRAFEMSERFELPVLLRTTTRVSHTTGLVSFDEIQPPSEPAGFKKDFRRYVTMPPISLQRHGVLLETMAEVEEAVEADEFAHVEGSGPLGLVSSGISRNYVHDAIRELDALSEVRHLELEVTHPLPRRRCAEFLADVERVVVVEELEPVIENELKQIASEEGRIIEIVGKSVGELGRQGEYTPDMVLRTLAGVLGRPVDKPKLIDLWGDREIPGRPPALCAGCPHRASYYALKLTAGDDAIFAGDIGCYTLGALPPFEMQDTMLCMGASTATAGGLAETNDKKIVAIIGDSTFFHSGIAGLVNAIRNGHNYTLAILDNSTTAMTGHQSHPASTDPARGKRVSIEEVVRGLGVDKIEVVDPMSLPDITQKAADCLEYDGVSVMICREPCPLYERKINGPPAEKVVYRVDQNLCKTCGFKTQGLHCGVETCSSTELWRSSRKVDELAKRGQPPERMRVPPCGASCPVNICVHGYVANIAAGDYAAAVGTIRTRNPLPSVCSRVCHRPCEDACYRDDFEGPVAINRLKRFVCDWATEHPDEVHPPAVPARHDERVAVIGSGPAGLACAHDLALRGYPVTVFEQMAEPGGLLRYGIPPYRLPDDVLDRDIDWIRELGVEFRCGVSVGTDVSLAELQAEGFAAFFLATGAWKPHVPEAIGGGGLVGDGGVDTALDFLRRVNEAPDPAGEAGELLGGRRSGAKVVVVGGGNSGIDASRCALRLGAGSVTVIELQREDGTAAIPHEIAAARAEGVEFRFQTTVEGVLEEDGAVAGVEVIHVDETDDGQTERIDADVVLVATGQKLDPATLPTAEVAGTDDSDNWINTESSGGATKLAGVFAAGDAVDGPGSVIEVMAAAKKSAFAIDAYLADGQREVDPLEFHDHDAYADQAEYEPIDVAAAEPVEPARLGPDSARRDFGPPEWTFSEEEANAEAERCLACGACANCNVCIDHFACVAIYRDDAGRVRVNEALCNGCGVCAELCPNNAYVRVELGRQA